MRKQFGGRITKGLTERYAKSKHWDGAKFVNLEETTMDVSFFTIPKLLYKQFCQNAGRVPVKPIPVVPFHKTDFLSPSDRVKFIWYGHSVLLMRIEQQTILIDPMFGPDAAPIAPFASKRFSDNTLDIIDLLPEIDLLLLSHDHYDHLDYESLQRLMPKVKQFYVALGVARHLIQWGVASEQIQEFDWWERQNFDDIEITFTPSRHFSGRGLKDRAKSLWGGWTFKTSSTNLYFSGDGGYGTHFKTVGERLGPFDLGFMECGQYNPLWHQIHMYPEEVVKAAIDARVRMAMPVHWGAFSLAHHTWKEPATRFANAAKDQIEICTPEIGQLITLGKTATDEWWDKYV